MLPHPILCLCFASSPSAAFEHAERGPRHANRLTRIPECKQSKECAPAKHHYDECAERVTAAQEAGAAGATEDCVEECEFFPLCCTVLSVPSDASTASMGKGRKGRGRREMDG